MFTYMLHDLARAYTPRIERVLCIGLGIGIVPMDFAREGAQVDVAEINPAVLPIARQYFGLEPERLNIAFGDGRYLLNRFRQQYDAVILDVFLGDSSPVHLMTREAFVSMKRVLRPEGTLVLNCFGDFDPGRDFYVASLEKTLKSVFQSVRIHNWRNGGNVFFVASQTDLAIRHEPTFDHVLPVCRHEVETAFSRVLETDPNHGIVLTDNYNPLEYYDAANREEVRRTLADAMRRR
jgi:spermidine synthase